MNKVRQADLGTPARTSTQTVRVEIDGMPTTVSAGTSIMRVARETGANVVTTEYSDWATECPEYKVTAVQVAPASHRSGWQDGFAERAEQQRKIAETN